MYILSSSNDKKSKNNVDAVGKRIMRSLSALRKTSEKDEQRVKNDVQDAPNKKPFYHAATTNKGSIRIFFSSKWQSSSLEKDNNHIQVLFRQNNEANRRASVQRLVSPSLRNMTIRAEDIEFEGSDSGCFTSSSITTSTSFEKGLTLIQKEHAEPVFIKREHHTMKHKNEPEYTSFFHLWSQPLERHISLKKKSSFELKRQPSLLSLVSTIDKLQSISTHDDMLQNVKYKGKEGSRLHVSENGQDVLVMEIASNKLQVVAGTLEKLFIKLADESAQDFDYIDTYILCHLFFTDSLELLENLMARFHLEALIDDMHYFNRWQCCIQVKKLEMYTRVLNIILRWIKLQFQDFKRSPVLMTRLEAFLHGDVDRSGYKMEASMIREALDEQKLVSFDTDLKLQKDTRLTFCDDLTDISSMNSKDAAKHLTLADFYILKCITAQDYLAMFFSKTENKTDYIALMTERTNKLSKWVLEQVTLYKLHSKQRKATLRKIMEIAKLCLSWSNFHTCMVITMGLTQLEEFSGRDWQQTCLLPNRDIVTFKNLFKYLNVCNNMSYYRHAFKKAAKSPCIPFFPIILKDLTFFIEGNATKKPDGLINFLKFRVLFQSIRDILSYTMEDYHFTSSLDQVFESLLNKKVHSTSLCD